MQSQVYEGGFNTTLFYCIIDHRNDDSAMTKSDMHVITKRGTNNRMKKSTYNWKHLVR